MKLSGIASAVIMLVLTSVGYAQFPSPPEGVTVFNSKFREGVQISWKENDICETTSGVRSYTGYIHLPPNSLDEQDYPINTFFWFFEARKDPENTPLAIYLEGGPGGASTLSVLSDRGPCYVHSDANSTYLNELSWNNELNMLFLDQPVQTGLSYDTLQNVTWNIYEGIRHINETEPVPKQNATMLIGTCASQNESRTARGTHHAAKAAWHFLQTFIPLMGEFPGYRSNDSRISIIGTSHGGHWAPGFASYFERQNARIENGDCLSDGVIETSTKLHIDTVVIIDGIIDALVQAATYPTMAYNDTYGIRMVNETQWQNMTDSYIRPGGCRDQILECRAIAEVNDPRNLGFDATTNYICGNANMFCYDHVFNSMVLDNNDYSPYNIADLGMRAESTSFIGQYLSQKHVQQAMGVPLNISVLSVAVMDAFSAVGDWGRYSGLDDLAYLLDSGIKVALIHGDSDYICNWYGGELISLAINHSSAASFSAAGYANIETNASYVGGQVRQYGNLSFSRVYNAGHGVVHWQPETAYQILMRALSDRDVATGQLRTGMGHEYSSCGPENTLQFRNERPAPRPLRYCNTLQPWDCTREEDAAVADETATICNYIVKSKNSTILFPELMGSMDDEGCGLIS